MVIYIFVSGFSLEIIPIAGLLSSGTAEANSPSISKPEAKRPPLTSTRSSPGVRCPPPALTRLLPETRERRLALSSLLPTAKDLSHRSMEIKGPSPLLVLLPVSDLMALGLR